MTNVRRPSDSGIGIALAPAMRGTIWITDREPGIRLLFGELMPEAEVIEPGELNRRLRLPDRPEAMVIDGTQLLELSARQRATLLALPRVLVCTGLSLTSIPMSLVAGPNVSVLAKPFCVEDLEVAVEWLREGSSEPAPSAVPILDAVSRRRGHRAPRPAS
jgi:hypothetical protein